MGELKAVGKLVLLRSSAQRSGQRQRAMAWDARRRLWWWLWSRCPGMGWVRLNRLWAQLPDPALAWAMPTQQLCDWAQLPPSRAAALDAFRAHWGEDPLASAKLAVESAKKVTSEAAAAANKRLVESKAKHEAASERVIALENELRRAAEGNKAMTTQTLPSLLSSTQGKMSLGLNVLLALTLLAVLRLHGGGGRGGKRAKQGEYME